MNYQMVPQNKTLCYKNSTWQRTNVKEVAKAHTPIIQDLLKKRRPVVEASPPPPPAAVKASPLPQR